MTNVSKPQRTLFGCLVSVMASCSYYILLRINKLFYDFLNLHRYNSRYRATNHYSYVMACAGGLTIESHSGETVLQ